MFEILKNKTICLTRGDIANLVVSASLKGGESYTFQQGDVVRLTVYKKRGCSNVLIEKEIVVEEASQTVTIRLEKEDTRFGDLIIAPTDYWYEVELNPDTEPQTIIGYDADGEKIFRLYPEGGEKA